MARQPVPCFRLICANIQRETAIMTDEASWYRGLYKDFASHEAVNHTLKEYVHHHEYG
jgi:hypothetical protein